MNDVFLDLGFIKIYWYSVFILVGVLIGIFIVNKEAKRVGLSSVLINDLCFFIIPVALIGARLYYVLFNFSSYKDNYLDILKIWEGGLAIYGAIIAGIIFLICYCAKKQINILRTMDVFVPSLILAQAIGRWGNFFNQEAYGPLISRSLLEKMFIPEFIIEGMNINGSYYQPTFFYESIWCILGFILLMLIRYLWKKNKVGNITFIYFIWYGIGRFFIESLRQDSLYIGDYRVSQIVSLVLIVVGVFGILFSKKRALYKEPKIKYENKKDDVLILG